MYIIFFNPGIIIGVLLLLCIVAFDTVSGWIVPIISFLCNHYVVVLIITIGISFMILYKSIKEASKRFIISACIMWIIVDVAMALAAFYFLDLFVYSQGHAGFLLSIFGGLAMLVYLTFDIVGGLFVKYLGFLEMEEDGGRDLIGFYILAIVYLAIGYIYFSAMAGSIYPYDVLEELLLFTR